MDYATGFDATGAGLDPYAGKTTAQLEEELAEALPGWRVWAIATYDRRRLWSAQPDGADGAVISGVPTPAGLVAEVRHYCLSLPARIAQAKQEIALLAPGTGYRGDQIAVQEALIAALEKLQADQDAADLEDATETDEDA